MPVVKIDVTQGKSESFLISFMDCVHDSMMEVLKIPANDKNIRVQEYKPALFVAKPPYQYFIEITMFSGRTRETKTALFKSIVEKLQTKLSIEPATVFIIINDQPKENWGVRGGISAADITFDFKIEI